MAKDTLFKQLRDADPDSVYMLIHEKDNKEGLLLVLNIGIYVLTFSASVYMLENVKILFVRYFSALSITIPTISRSLIKMSFYNSLVKLKGHLMIKWLSVIIISMTFVLFFSILGILIMEKMKSLDFLQDFLMKFLLILSCILQIFDMIFWTYSKPKKWGSEGNE
ncbi:hypothetical protein [Levilactobacillus brevis]|uniref:hypothetical protein n=1 Tax=Levilactobacillus brevis TaxID=1580 RepID=UPI0020737E28|nr:hypothetical protein [Levilactobacillus brevis]